MPRSITDSVVAVVGAGGGLGRPISELLHARGASLLVAGPHAERLPDLDPSLVAERIVTAIEHGEAELAASAFSSGTEHHR